jgi:transposase-like protein
MQERSIGTAGCVSLARALATLNVTPTEVVADKAPTYPRVLDELAAAAWHHFERYANNE